MTISILTLSALLAAIFVVRCRRQLWLFLHSTHQRFHHLIVALVVAAVLMWIMISAVQISR